MRKIINLIIESNPSPTSSEIYAICNDGTLFRLDFGNWTRIRDIPQDGYAEGVNIIEDGITINEDKK